MKSLFIYVLLGFSTWAYTQNQISGKVSDSTTGEPLPFVEIYIPLLEKGTVSDANGQFTLSNLPGGSVKVIIRLLGYETQNFTVNTLNKEELNVQLSPTLFEMNEVVVSTPFQRLQSENVMKIEKTSVAELMKSGRQR